MHDIFSMKLSILTLEGYIPLANTTEDAMTMHKTSTHFTSELWHILVVVLHLLEGGDLIVSE